MTFSEYKPNIKLNNLIHSYYLIHNHATTHENIPPLGHPVIQFHLRNNINTLFSNYNFPIEEVIIVGQLSKYAKVNYVEASSIIGVNLKPTALYKLLNTSIEKFTDKGTPASYYFENEMYILLALMKVSKSDEEKKELLDNYFINLVNDKPVLYDKFDTLIDNIIEKKGKLSINEIIVLHAVVKMVETVVS